MFGSAFFSFSRLRVAGRLAISIWLAGALHAADTTKPVVGPGASEEDVIAAFGWPNGQSQSGTKEVWNYAQGNVTFDHGRVEKVDFLPNVPWQKPRPRPGPPTASTAKKPEAPLDFWLTDFAQATREATRRRANILALFTGSDWSPASKKFHDEVEFDPEFVNAFTGDFVFLRLDYPTRAPQPPVEHEQNERLRERYGVTTYPSLLILSSEGTALATVDLAKPRNGDSYRADVIAAIREVAHWLNLTSPPPAPSPAAQAPVSVPPKPSARAALSSTLRSAGWLVTSAVLLGAGLALLAYWFIWKDRAAKAAPALEPISHRIADAASGLPTSAEIAQWSHAALCGLAAALAEAEGHAAEVRGAGGEVDVVFRQPGEARPRGLVVCVPGEKGIVGAKRVRELLAEMTVEGAPTGWVLAPRGFSAEARTFADTNRIVVFNDEQILACLRELPPLVLPSVLARARAHAGTGG